METDRLSTRRPLRYVYDAIRKQLAIILSCQIFGGTIPMALDIINVPAILGNDKRRTLKVFRFRCYPKASWGIYGDSARGASPRYQQPCVGSTASLQRSDDIFQHTLLTPKQSFNGLHESQLICTPGVHPALLKRRLEKAPGYLPIHSSKKDSLIWLLIKLRTRLVQWKYAKCL